MSFLDVSILPILIVGEIIGAPIGSAVTYLVMKAWSKRNLGDPKQKEKEWEAKMNAVGDKAVEKIQTWFKGQEEEASKQPPLDVKIDSGPIVAQITEVIDKKMETWKMSEMGKISGMVRSTQAAQVALASESNPRLMGILTGIGLSKKESAAIMMALAESGTIQGLPQGLNGGQQQNRLPGI